MRIAVVALAIIISVGVAAGAYMILGPGSAAARSGPKGRQGTNFAVDGKTDARLTELWITGRNPFQSRGKNDPGPSLRMSFSMFRADRDLLRVQANKSRVLQFCDDRGTLLADRPPKDGLLSSFGAEEDHPHCLEFDVNSDRVPVPGAGRIRLDADVVVVCGAEPKAVKVLGFRLEPGNKFRAGPFEVLLSKPDSVLAHPSVAGSGREIVFAWNAIPGKEVLGLKFFDPAGTEIPSERKGEITSLSRSGDPEGWSRSYVLSRKADMVTIVAVYYDRLEEIVVPIRADTGVGF